MFRVEVWEPVKRRFLRSVSIRSSTYEVETERQLWEICTWATGQGFEARVFRLELSDV